MTSNRAALELRVPPLALTVVLALVAGLVCAMTPELQLGIPVQPRVATVLAIAGCAVAATGVAQFRRARTTVDPRAPERTDRLVTHGIYRVSRNPMYLGFALLLTAWAVWLPHPAAVAAVPTFVLYMNRFQIAPEERRLRQRFGTAYQAYCRRVRRWL